MELCVQQAAGPGSAVSATLEQGVRGPSAEVKDPGIPLGWAMRRDGNQPRPGAVAQTVAGMAPGHYTYCSDHILVMA